MGLLLSDFMQDCYRVLSIARFVFYIFQAVSDLETHLMQEYPCATTVSVA
jgi:hypothetical protein